MLDDHWTPLSLSVKSIDTFLKPAPLSLARSQHYRTSCRDCKDCEGKDYTSDQSAYKDSVANETSIWRYLDQVVKNSRIALNNIKFD